MKTDHNLNGGRGASASEAEEALIRALQAKAIADVLGENLSRMFDGRSPDLRGINTFSLIAQGSSRLLDDLVEFLERVRDEAQP